VKNRYVNRKGRHSGDKLDMKGLIYILIVSVLFVLTSISLMESLVEAKGDFKFADEQDKHSEDLQSTNSISSSHQDSSSLIGNKAGGTVGSIDFEMNTEENTSQEKIKIINSGKEDKDKNNKVNKTVNTAEDNPDAIDVLVNKDHRLPEDYTPENLVTPNVSFAPGSAHKTMRKEAARALEELFNAAEADGIVLYAVSGYRSFATQQVIFNNNIDEKGSMQAANMYSARPGESEHQTGLAMDITSQSVGYQLSVEFGETDEGKWVSENAHKYGFIVRYLSGKEQITGYAYEPWHIRYLGVELATEVYKSGLTYEEYLEQ